MENNRETLLRHWPLLLEFFLLCVIVPGTIIGFRLAHLMLPFLWAATFYTCIVYQRKYFTTFRDLWHAEAITRREIGFLLLRWAGVSLFIYGFTLWYDPDRLFHLVRERPHIIPVLLTFYPLFSALPQEFIFCNFFFRRYETLFGRGRALVVASALCFAFAHILFINAVAPVLSFFAGLIFAAEYKRTRSLALVTLEHSLYGISLFLIGLGWYFYAGSVQ
jgi:uncharacterized protein